MESSRIDLFYFRVSSFFPNAANTSRISGVSRRSTSDRIASGTPYAASATDPAIAAIVSLSPPIEMAFRMASSNPSDSKNATSAGDGPAAGRFKPVILRDRGEMKHHGVKVAVDIAPDLCFRRSGLREKDGARYCRRAPDPVRVIVGDSGYPLRELLGLFKCLRIKPAPEIRMAEPFPKLP